MKVLIFQLEQCWYSIYAKAEQEYEELEMAVREFQNTTMRLGTLPFQLLQLHMV